MPEKKKSNFYTCLLIGCGGVIVLAICGVLVMVFGTKWALNKAIDTYTETQPQELPISNWTPEQHKQVEERLEKFKNQFDAGDAVTLELSADEINALISKNPKVQGKAYISLEGDQIKGWISIPLDEFFPEGEKRYLNGEATFRVKIENGLLEIYLDSLTAKGNSLPGFIMNELKGKNLANDAQLDEETRKALERIERLEVKNKKFIFIIIKDENNIRTPATKEEQQPATIEKPQPAVPK